MSQGRTLRSMRSLPSLRMSLHSSSSAPKPSHLLSSQRDSIRTHYTSLTVPVLKQECRQRGLKLTGKKVDLIDRLVGFDQAKSFSSSSESQAGMAMLDSKVNNLTLEAPPTSPQAAVNRAFSSTANLDGPRSVDAYDVPVPPKADTTSHPVTKIPVGPESQGKAVFSDLSQKEVNADTGASAGDVHVVYKAGTEVSNMNVDLGDGSPQHEEEKSSRNVNYSIPAKDKPFLFALGGAIAAWWGSQYITNDFDDE